MRALLIGAVATGLAGPAVAQQTASPPQSSASPQAGWREMTAKELAGDCHSQDTSKHAGCIGYVRAIYDLQFSNNPPGLCLPPTLTPDTLTEVVVAYIDTHEDGPAPAAVAQSIVRFFPCTSNTTPTVRR